MSNSRLTLGYREVEACADTPLLQRGQRVGATSFIGRCWPSRPIREQSVYRVVDQENRPEGFRIGSVWASYIHIHLGSAPGLAQRFVDTCVLK